MILGLVIGVGVFGINVIISSLFDPLIISVTFLFQPVIVALLVWLLGIQAFPGEITWIRTFILLPGMVMIIIGQNQIDPTEEVNNDKLISNGKQPLAYELFLAEHEAIHNEANGKNMKSIRGK